MYRFFIDENQVNEDEIIIVGSDVNHISNVLRLKLSDTISLCNQKGTDYICTIVSLTKEEIHCRIIEQGQIKSELPIQITLVQGAPKQEKMELIIQKSVELGVFQIMPVEMKRSIVKYDDKKVDKKLERWQSIAEAAAKQAKRGIVPKIIPFQSWKKTLEQLKHFDKVIVPYEHEEGISRTRDIFSQLKKSDSIAIVIGPEGGFDESEIADLVGINAITVSLGNRILRTETAGFAAIAMIVYQTEEA